VVTLTAAERQVLRHAIDRATRLRFDRITRQSFDRSDTAVFVLADLLAAGPLPAEEAWQAMREAGYQRIAISGAARALCGISANEAMKRRGTWRLVRG
jgi:hypothetical protein